MRIVTASVFMVGVFASAAFAGPADSVDGTQLVQTYCAGCHNGVMRSPSGALLDRFDTASIASNPDVWSRAYRQMQAGTMPPFGAPRPDRMASGKLLSSIETALGASAPPAAEATDQEIADRLATLLWNSAPDAALSREAGRHRLTRPATLEKQIQRMLADERAAAFVSRFFFPWLGLDRLPNDTFPLRDAMATETDLFIRSQLRDNRDPVELWDATRSSLRDTRRHGRAVSPRRPVHAGTARAARSGQHLHGDLTPRGRLHVACCTSHLGAHTLPGGPAPAAVSRRAAGETRVANHAADPHAAGHTLRAVPSQLLPAWLWSGAL